MGQWEEETAHRNGKVKRKKIYAIVGCIGSGKTTVSSMLEKDYFVQNADRVAGEVLATKQEELIGRYGRKIMEDGAISKSYLSRMLFSEGETGAEEREWIGRLVNEEVLIRIKERASADARGVSFAEITAPTPELLRMFDGVIVVFTSEEEAMRRTANRASGWSERMRRDIYRMQSERIKLCLDAFGGDVHEIDNQAGEEELGREVHRLLEKMENATQRSVE